MLVKVAYYASSIAFFWPNYANIMLFFPNYATVFLKLCSLKKCKQVQNIYFLTRSRSSTGKKRNESPATASLRSDQAWPTPYCSLA